MRNVWEAATSAALGYAFLAYNLLFCDVWGDYKWKHAQNLLCEFGGLLCESRRWKKSWNWVSGASFRCDPEVSFRIWKFLQALNTRIHTTPHTCEHQVPPVTNIPFHFEKDSMMYIYWFDDDTTRSSPTSSHTLLWVFLCTYTTMYTIIKYPQRPGCGQQCPTRF